MLQQLLLSNIKFKVSQTLSLQLPRLVQQVPAHTPLLPAPGEHHRHHHCHHHLHRHNLQVSLGNLTTTFHQHDHHHCQINSSSGERGSRPAESRGGCQTVPLYHHTGCQTLLRKFWHSELFWWDLLFNLTLSFFGAEQYKVHPPYPKL